MLRRTGFKRKPYHRPPMAPLRPVARSGVVAQISSVARPVPKEDILRSEAYRRLVAAMPCKFCGISGYSQAAHPNTGKGMGFKTDDRGCFPLCGTRATGGGMVTGCHELFDLGMLFSKSQRREIEPIWGAETRASIMAAGAWPQGLPLYV
jgi:hypothetical protein